MSPTEPSWSRVKSVFERVLEADPAARRDEVERCCPGEPALREAVLRLLESHEQAGDFLEPPRTDEIAQRLQGEDTDEVEFGAASDDGVVAGRYELGAPLGSGGAGSVFRAYDRLSKQDVAVKLLPSLSKSGLEAVRREVGLLRLLRLPGVVRMLDDGVERGQGFIVMQLVEGAPFPGPNPPRSWPELVPVLMRLLEALGRIHWSGVVHRDLKPANVLVSPDGVPTVLDLGISREGPVGPVDGTIAGTPRYLAPEIRAGGLATASGDLYAVGVMLQDLFETFDVPPPEHALTIAERLLRKNPDDRPSSAGAVLGMLDTGHTTAVRKLVLPAFGSDGRLPEEALRALFAGPDRIHHLREDAAHELWRRTDGWPVSVREELAAWERAGLARVESGRMVIDRRALERLRSGLRVRLPRSGLDPEGLALDEAQGDVLRAVDLAGRAATAASVAAMLDRPLEAVERDVEELAAQEFVRVFDHGEIQSTDRVGGPRPWEAERRQAMHRALAAHLPRGSEDRLLHLLAAGELDQVPAEAATISDRSPPQKAIYAVTEALKALETHADPAWEDKMLDALMRVVLQGGMGANLEMALYIVGRHPSAGEKAARVEATLKAALLVMRGDAARGARMVPPPEQAETETELTGQTAVRLLASRYMTADAGAAIRDDLETWAEANDSEVVREALFTNRGWVAYLAEDYETAAADHERAAERTTVAWTRLAFGLNAASALLEAGRLDDCEALARRGVETAASLRMAQYEARAEWLARAAGYRRGDPMEPDEDLVEAARILEMGNQEALIFLNEAAVAWRAGRREQAGELAELAAACWGEMGQDVPAALARALALALGATAGEDELDRLVATARAATPTERIQILHLIGCAAPERRVGLQRAIDEAAAAIPRETWDARRELLSISECVQSEA